MDELGLFTAALGLSAPWRVTWTEFDGERLDLSLDFPRGARFACSAKDCAQGACPVHDSESVRHCSWLGVRKRKQSSGKNLSGSNRAAHPTRSALEPFTQRIEAQGGGMLLGSIGSAVRDAHGQWCRNSSEAGQRGQRSRSCRITGRHPDHGQVPTHYCPRPLPVHGAGRVPQTG
jgi:hypothetical protein